MTVFRVRWGLVLTAVIVGALLTALASEDAGRGVASYLGGLILVTGAFEFGAFNIRLTGKYAPGMTMAVAVATYFTTTVAFGLVLAASSPRVVSGTCVAIGLFVGMTIWLTTFIAQSWVRSDRGQEPVNIRARDETIPRIKLGGPSRH